MTKRMFAAMSSLVLLAALALSASAQTGNQTQPTAEKTTKTKTTTKTKHAMPTDDASIQKCISDKLVASAKLKDQGFTVTVSNGVATLTGNAKNAGSKGAATKIAKSCGAKTVTNDIAVQTTAKTPKTKTKTTSNNMQKDTTKKP